MRFPTPSCLLYRHSVLSKAWNTQRVTTIIPSQPASSLSAIHHGLRESEKSRPQGFNRKSLEVAKTRRPSQNSRRNRDPDWSPPTFKIKRGKKDVTDRGPERQSRRSRFNDPENSFGKRSLVYQMKHGALRQKMAELETRDHAPNTSSSRRTPNDRLSSDDFMKDFSASAGQSTGSARDGKRGRISSHVRRPAERESRARNFADTRGFDKERKPRLSSFADTRSLDKDRTHRASSFADARSFAKERKFRTEFPSSGRETFDVSPSFRTHRESPSTISEHLSEPRDTEERKTRREYGSSRVDDGPIRIHHTTAASQFLYGRSVVEAALKDSRRQLYKLYIYSGDDRRNVAQDDALEQLARRKGVDVTKVPNNGLRMMDKMSGGRPHNGCVLEASPLPQLPLKALGPLSEDPAKPGFYVDMAHQSSEEAKVNGTTNFINYQLPKERKPFILLLDGILDPGNLGAILRTAAFLGVNGIAITRDSSATLTAVALKASAGASEVATLFSVSSTVDFLTRSKENGWSVYAAVPSTKRSRGNSHLTVDRVETYDPLSSQPTVLVIGSEGEGLSKPVRRLADHEVSIPSPSGGFLSVVDSLNVSVATGILCTAFLKKQSSGMIEIEEELLESKRENNPVLW